MPHLGSIKRRELIACLRRLGFSGPFAGGRHEFMRQFRLQFDGVAATPYTVFVTTNLINWTPLSPATETTPGHYEFTDADAPNHSTRFYQLRSP